MRELGLRTLDGTRIRKYGAELVGLRHGIANARKHATASRRHI